MLLDIIVFILCLVALFKGLRKGFVLALFAVLAFIIGLAAALKLSAVVATYLGHNISVAQKWLPFLAFLLVFIIVIILVRLGAKLIEGALKMAMLGWLNRIGGVIFYLFLYIFVFSILLFYAVQLHLVKEETLNASMVYPYIAPLAPKMMHLLGEMVPAFRNLFEKLLQFFQHVSNKSH